MILIKKELKDFPKLNFLLPYLEGHEGFIAGGCFKNIFKNEPVKDIDLFFKNVADFDKADTYFITNPSYEIVFANKNAISYLNKETQIRIELVRSMFGNPEEVVKNFDFSVTRFAIHRFKSFMEFMEAGQIEATVLYADNYFEDLLLHRLNLDVELIKFPARIFDRALRYKGYGFNLDIESKQRLITCINCTKDSSKLGDLSEDNYF